MNKYIKPIIVVIVIAGALAWYFTSNMYKNSNGANQQISQNVSSSTNARILTKLKSIILLPDDAVPSMAIVTNADLLKSATTTATFFANARNSDYLVIYPNIAILYDPAANKIMNIGSVTNPVQIPSTAASTTKKAK
jgi:hypothetical protein